MDKEQEFTEEFLDMVLDMPEAPVPMIPPECDCQKSVYDEHGHVLETCVVCPKCHPEQFEDEF